MVHQSVHPEDNTPQMQFKSKSKMQGMGQMGANGGKLGGKTQGRKGNGAAQDNLELPMAVEVGACETTRKIEKGEVVEQCKSQCSKSDCITLVSSKIACSATRKELKRRRVQDALVHAKGELQNAGETDEWADENAANASGPSLMSLEMLSVKSSKIVSFVSL